MKKLMYVLSFFLPLVVFSQQNLYKYSPIDYMWMNVGDSNLSYNPDWWSGLSFNPVNGQSYVAFIDVWGMNVMKYDGTIWQYVGAPDFSGPISSTCGSIGLSPTGQAYIGYNDRQFLPVGRLTVMKFNGSVWDTVGNAGFSNGEVL